MKTLNFRSDRVVDFFRESFQENADQAMAEAAVLELVRRKEISAMTGADLLGLHLTDFVELMTRHGLSYFTEPPQDPDEVAARWRARRASA